MALKTPTNQLTDKDIHTRTELWGDIICSFPYFYSNKEQFNSQGAWWKKDHELTYAPIPSRFGEIKKELINIFAEQEKIAKKILEEEKPKLQEILIKISNWLNLIHPANTGNREIEPVRRDLNSLRFAFEMGSLDQKIKILEEFLEKKHLLPQIDEIEVLCKELKSQWEKARSNSNICFIKKDMAGNLKFVFQPENRIFTAIDDYLFYRNGVFYEVSGWERINHENAIVDCVRSKFINGYYDLYSKGFSGITHNSPYLTARHEKCACPNFPNANRTNMFFCSWQPTYQLWYLYSPLTRRKTHHFTLRSRGIDSGTLFTYYELKKLEGEASTGWIQDTVYFFLPQDYREGSYPVHETKVKEEIFWKSWEDNSMRLEEWLKNGIDLIIGGEREKINLWENPHLLEHINVQFYYSGKEIKTCRLIDLRGDGSIVDKPKLEVLSNLSGIHYQMRIGLVLVRWHEQISFTLEAGKFASWLIKMGSAFADLVPTFGTTLSDATSATLDTMKSFSANLESKTSDSKGGFEERDAERRNQLTTISDNEFVDSNPQQWDPPKEGMDLNGVPIKNLVERKHGRKYTSWRFKPGRAVVSALGSLPALLASSISKNDYSLYDFALRKFGDSLEIQLSYNLDLFEHYVNTKKVGKNEGLLLINERQFINKINKAGFYRFTPHLIEKDTNNFFADKLTSGLHLYKNNPGEIWDAKLGVASARSVVSFQRVSGIGTTVDERESSIFVEDKYSGKDGRSWLTHNSWFGEKGGKTNYLPELINSRPKTNAPNLNSSICVGCRKFRPHFKNITECWNFHWSADKIQCNVDGTGDRMSALYKDEDLVNNFDNWTTKNTEYFRTDDYTKSWSDEFKTYNLPELNYKGNLDWKGFPFPGKSSFDTYDEAYSEGVKIFGPPKEKGYSYYSQDSTFLPAFFDKLRGDTTISNFEVKEGRESSSPTTHEIESRGRKVNQGQFTSYDTDSNYATYRKIIKKPQIIGSEVKSGFQEVKDVKGTTKPESYSYLENKYSEPEYEYYVLKRDYKKMYYLAFEWKKKTKSGGSTIETKETSLGKGSEAKNKYESLPIKNRGKKVTPNNPFIGAGEKIPSWKFNALGSWSSVNEGKRIKLDKGKKYHADLSAFEVIPGEGKKSKIFTFDKSTDDGKDWEAWLEQSGPRWEIMFSHLCLISSVIGDTEGSGVGISINEFMENFEDVKSENLGEALSEGLNQVKQEQKTEQALSIDEIQELIHLPQEQLEQQFTQEQIRQIQAEQIRRAEEARQAEETYEDENWSELNRDGSKTKHGGKK